MRRRRQGGTGNENEERGGASGAVGGESGRESGDEVFSRQYSPVSLDVKRVKKRASFSNEKCFHFQN